MAGPIEQMDRPSQQVLSNAEIADRLASLAQLLSAQKENPYKVKAYQRAAARIRTFSESLDELVRDDSDLTRFAGIGEAIASAIREIVLTGTLGKLEKLRAAAPPALASISDHPRLDPKIAPSAAAWSLNCTPNVGVRTSRRQIEFNIRQEEAWLQNLLIQAPVQVQKGNRKSTRS